MSPSTLLLLFIVFSSFYLRIRLFVSLYSFIFNSLLVNFFCVSELEFFLLHKYVFPPN